MAGSLGQSTERQGSTEAATRLKSTD